LELIASTYNFRCVGAENAKKGVSLLASDEPDCVIFDFETLKNQRQRATAKKRFEGNGVPVLFLNENGNDLHTQGQANTPLKIEPIVKFIIDNCGKDGRTSNGGFLKRLLSLCRLWRA
jgi:hypothetical protein